MSAADLLTNLASRGVRLTVSGDRLRVEAPVGVVTLALRQRIVECKPDLMRLLSDSATGRCAVSSNAALSRRSDEPSALTTTTRGYLVPTGLPEPWLKYYEERAAIREYVGEQLREHAEAEALRETLAAMQRAEQAM